MVTGHAGNTGFPQRLEQLRKEKKLTQRGLASLIGVHYTHVGRYERGESNPSITTLPRLAAALGTTNDYLLEGTTGTLAADWLSDRDLLRQFQQVEKLPANRKTIVKELIEAFLVREQMKKMVA